MSAKFIALFILLISTATFVNPHLLTGMHWGHFPVALTIVVTSFGYSVIIPSLRAYYNSDIVKLRKIILIGSLIPLACYLLWITAVLGVLPLQGPYSLDQIYHANNPNTELMIALNYYSDSGWIKIISNLFASICMITSFMGVSLCLADFLADGLTLEKRGVGGIKVFTLTFLPPLLIVLFYPAIFILGLSYAGVFCSILMILMPSIMVWRGRYQKNMPAHYRLMGGKLGLAANFVAGLIIIFIGGLADLIK